MCVCVCVCEMGFDIRCGGDKCRGMGSPLGLTRVLPVGVMLPPAEGRKCEGTGVIERRSDRVRGRMQR